MQAHKHTHKQTHKHTHTHTHTQQKSKITPTSVLQVQNLRLQVAELQRQNGSLQQELTQRGQQLLRLQNFTNNLLQYALCASCGTQHNLKRCAWCHVVSYCSRECQYQHWEVHRHACGAPHCGAGRVVRRNHNLFSSMGFNRF